MFVRKMKNKSPAKLVIAANKNQQRIKWIRTSGHGNADLPEVIYMVTAGCWEHNGLERSHPCLGKVLLFAAHGSVGFFLRG